MSSTDRISVTMRRWQWAIWSHEGPSHVAQRAVAQVLFDYLVTSPDGRVFPSTETIAEKTALTRKTVSGHLEALVEAGWIARQLKGQGGQAWRRYEYILRFPKHVDPSSDDFLQRAERKRLDAIDEHRIENEWHPRDDAEAERRSAKGDSMAADYLLDNFDSDKFPTLDLIVFYRLTHLRQSVANVNKTWLNTNAGQLAQYGPGEQSILVEWIENNEKSSLPSHQACRAILKQRRAAA